MQACQSVLYVDDDPDICEIVQATLCLISGLDITTANSGETAIDLLYARRPDLLILDVMMPGLDGPTTYKRIRQSALISDTPVIFMTAKVLPAEVAQLMQLGAIGVVGKPFDPLKLGDQLQNLWHKAKTSPKTSHFHNGKEQVLAKVDDLAAHFIARSLNDVIRLRQLNEDLGRGNFGTLKEIERIGHSIHGAGYMFGFTAVGESGKAIENIAEEMSDPLTAHTITAPILASRIVPMIADLARQVELGQSTTNDTHGMLQDLPPLD